MQKDAPIVRVIELLVTEDREEHIARHGVEVHEAEEVALGEHLALRSRDGHYLLIGQTDAGRYLTVVVGPRGGGVYGLVTARDADRAERRLYQRRRGY